MNTIEVIRLIKLADFRPLTKMEEDAFGGVQTDDPKIAQVEHYSIILDGEDLHIVDNDSNIEFGITLLATQIGRFDGPFKFDPTLCSACKGHFPADTMTSNPSDESERYCMNCMESDFGE